MKRGQVTSTGLFFACMIISVIFAVTIGVRAQDEPTPSETSSVSTQYGVFVNTIGRHLVDFRTMTEMVEGVNAIGFNCIIPIVRESGTVFYISNIERISGKVAAAFTDPLRALITQAQFPSASTTPVLQVYPALEILHVHNGKIDPFPAPNSVVTQREEWLSLVYGGEKTDESRLYMLDPALLQVQMYIKELVKELVNNYTIDGLFISDLYYPGKAWGYNPEAIRIFQQESGMTETPSPDNEGWADFRRERLTRLLREIVSAARETKPDLPIILAVEAIGAAPASLEDFKNSEVYTTHFQDWVSWAEEGLVDIICVQNYWREYAEADFFKGWLTFVKSLEIKSETWIAVSGKLNFTNDILEQIRAARTIEPKAIILDNFRTPSRDNKELALNSLKQTKFATEEQIFMRYREDLKDFLTPVAPTPVPTAEELTTPTAAISPEAMPVTIMETLPTSPTEITIIQPVSLPEEEEGETTPTLAITDVPTTTPTPVTLENLLPMTGSAVEWDTIYLKNGNVIRGRVVDRINEQVIIDTSEGLKLNLNESEVQKIEKP